MSNEWFERGKRAICRSTVVRSLWLHWGFVASFGVIARVTCVWESAMVALRVQDKGS